MVKVVPAMNSAPHFLCLRVWHEQCCVIPCTRGQMESYLIRHFQQLRQSEAFVESWDYLGSVLQTRYLAALRKVDQVACALGYERLASKHDSAARSLETRLLSVPDIEFSISPELDMWIREVGDVENVERSFLSAGYVLQDFLRGVGFPYIMRWRSIKREASVAQKIDIHRRSGRPLDLWDVVRFRFSFESPDVLQRVAVVMLQQFGDCVVRCRNYYVRRFGKPDNPYRALHFELMMPRRCDSLCFEVQLLTLTRDAIGLIDHCFVHKPDLTYIDDGHREWLQAMRMAANVIDAQDSVGA